jgi:hypothetical protein
VRALAPCSCQSLPLARTGGQALGPRLRGDDEQECRTLIFATRY